MPEEEKPTNSDGSPKEPTPDRNYDGMRIDKTIEEGKAEADASKNPAPTAESLGVDQASFDKFFKDGEFNWAAYGKEQAFKAQKKATGEPDKEPDKEEPKKSDAPKHSQTKEAEEAVTKAGLDWDGLGSKIAETGDIEAADYEALKGIGIPEDVVKTYIASVKKDAQDLVDAVIDASGGQDTFDKVFDALQEKPLELRNKIDGLLADPDTRDAGITLMFREAGMERPSAPATETPAPTKESPKPQNGAVNRSGGGGSDAKGYASFEEQVAAQRDPRYKTDVAYRNEVMARIAASTYSMNPRTHTGGL